MSEDLPELERALRKDPENIEAARAFILGLRRTNRGIEGTILEEWTRQLDRGSSPVYSCLQALGPLGDFAVPTLSENLRELRLNSRLQKTLGCLGDKGLLALVRNLNNVFLRKSIIDDLRSKRDRVTAMLLKRMEDEETVIPEIEIAALTTLGDPAIPMIVKALRNHEYAWWLVGVLHRMGKAGTIALSELASTQGFYSLQLMDVNKLDRELRRLIGRTFKMPTNSVPKYPRNMPIILAIAKNKSILKETMQAFDQLDARLEIK